MMVVGVTDLTLLTLTTLSTFTQYGRSLAQQRQVCIGTEEHIVLGTASLFLFFFKLHK